MPDHCLRYQGTGYHNGGLCTAQVFLRILWIPYSVHLYQTKLYFISSQITKSSLEEKEEFRRKGLRCMRFLLWCSAVNDDGWDLAMAIEALRLKWPKDGWRWRVTERWSSGLAWWSVGQISGVTVLRWWRADLATRVPSRERMATRVLRGGRLQFA